MPQLKHQGTAVLRGVPVPLMAEADTLTSVPSANLDSKHRGQRAASSHSSWPPATSEIASLCCHCHCFCRWLGPSKDESQWKSVSCCGCSCEESTGLQVHTLEIFFNRELFLKRWTPRVFHNTEKSSGDGKMLHCQPWEAAELCCAAAVLLDAEGRAAAAVHHYSPSDLV